MKNVQYDELTDLQSRALHEAEQVLEHSYNPYSHFSVGACLISDDEQLISGTNVENAAYGDTICAERGAIMRAKAMGVKSFRGIAIIARGEDFNTTEVTGPCGSCRQALYEISQVSDYDLEVILSTSLKDIIVITTIGELLPLAFGPVDLGMDISKYQKSNDELYTQDCTCQNYPIHQANDCHVHNINPRHFVRGEIQDCDCP